MNPLNDEQMFIRDFAAYARKRGNVRYDFQSSCNCATAQFLNDTKRTKVADVGFDHWQEEWCSGAIHDLPEALKVIPINGNVFNLTKGPLNTYPQTFSALADRLEALLPFETVDAEARVLEPA